jgi:RNA polymerase sigma factor (sigma-70 family)
MHEENGFLPADFSEIFGRYGSVIFTYLLLHASSREEAEDLTIDVFTAALELEAFLLWDAPRQIAWLKRVAYTRLVDSFRRSKRHPVIPLELVAHTMLDEQEPEDLAMRKEDYALLYQYISQLSPMQQELLRLCYGYELHTAEIAEMLNKSDAAIRQMLSRTLGLLRTMYNVKPVSKGEGA